LATATGWRFTVVSRAVGDGKHGALTTRIDELYWRRHDDDAFSTPIDYAGAG